MAKSLNVKPWYKHSTLTEGASPMVFYFLTTDYNMHVESLLPANLC